MISFGAGDLDYMLLTVTLFILYRLIVRLRRSNIRPPYPPGPSGWPFIGNLHTPPEPAWKTYNEWSKLYGSDVLRLNVLGSNIIILNSFESAVDLLDKRSSIYSDRPGSGITMLKELCGLGWSFGLQQYGPEWRDGRKAFQREFHLNAAKNVRPAETREVHKFLNRILRNPEGFLSHTHNMVAGQILSIAYGIEIEEHNDPYVNAAEEAAAAVSATLNPGSYLVDLFPFLKYVPEWMPGAGFKRQARIWRKSVIATRDKPWAFVKQQMDEDPAAAPVSVAKSLLENVIYPSKDPEYIERVVKSALGSMYLAGSDTTLAIIWSFFLTMVLHPDIFREAQDSVDRVCKERLPDFTDYDSLPYVHAIVKECLRWNPVVALNLVHRCTTDDIYREYFIPEGSIVVANLWAMLHDTNVYQEPEQFNPKRFLKMTGPDNREIELIPDIRDPTDIVFGFGRRICPGRHMAYDSLWLTIASLLSVFNIEKATDENGQDITPAGEYYYGFTCHPKPFMCKISPRSPEHQALILDVAEGV